METIKITLIKDFVMPGKTIAAGTEMEITQDRLQNFIDAGLVAGKKVKKEKKAKAAKIETAVIDK